MTAKLGTQIAEATGDDDGAATAAAATTTGGGTAHVLLLVVLLMFYYLGMFVAISVWIEIVIVIVWYLRPRDCLFAL